MVHLSVASTASHGKTLHPFQEVERPSNKAESGSVRMEKTDKK